jgi:hypothetical protein
MSLKFMQYNSTVATYFLVRPLGLCEKKESLFAVNPNAGKIVKKYGFVEAFFKDIEHVTENKYPVYVLFKPPNMIEFGEFLEEERTLDLIEDVYDYPGGYVVVVYKFPEIYHKDYDLIKEGRYSETSADFRSIFPNTSSDETFSLYHLVFNKHPDLRKKMEEDLGSPISEDTELWHYPRMDKETLDINNYTNMEEVK